ncbi:unnamed protein product [Urochloa decumbens]|uniref:Protein DETOXIFICATION n=1 Tax=Urochloa decumbens TaxID=240449 RepID=A0ABC9FUE6_9POAL
MESHRSDVPLLSEPPAEKNGGLPKRVWEESKKLWEVVGPAMFMRLVLYSMNVISQAFVGHLGDRELAAYSMANTVISGLSFGFLVRSPLFESSVFVLSICSGVWLDSFLVHLRRCAAKPTVQSSTMLGVYMQRSWLILLGFAVLLAPTYIFSGQLLVALGQPAELSRDAGLVSMYLLPVHFTFAILLPLNKFLQCQLKNWVTLVTTVAGFPVHVAATWLLVRYFELGVDFVKLSAASGVMMCLEIWYYRVLVFLTGYMKNAELAVDALSICMSLAAWELMIHVGFLAGTGVRVANELGASNGKGARFVTIVSTTTSFMICLFSSSLALIFHDKLAMVFTTSEALINAVDSLSVLLALTILLNGIQPVLCGVAVGSGWQALVAYVNIGSYYLIGVPLGVLLAWGFDYGVLGIWVGMIGGTTVQTLILTYITLRCDWNEEALKASSRMQRWSSSK